MTHSTAKKVGLEPIYAEITERGRRFFYDPKEGKYYDAATDLYFEPPGNISVWLNNCTSW